MKFEIVESKISRFEERAVQWLEEWQLDRRIRVANHQIRLAEDNVTTSLDAAARWRDYAEQLKDLRRLRGFKNRGNDWKPPLDWLSVGITMLTLVIAACTAVLAIH